MQDAQNSTLAKIHAAAFAEFEARGYQGASLRNIVKAAGVTTGAFYGYYPSKEALFAALAGTHYDWLMDCYCTAQQSFEQLPTEQKPDQMGEISGDCMEAMLDYAYDHLREVKLLLLSAEGTRYAHMVDEMAEIEREATRKYLTVLERLGRPAPPIDERLQHILITGMFNAFFELVVHDMPRAEAHAYLRALRAFYTAGWMKIMGQ